MALLPMAMYGLEVPSGDVAIMAHADIPAAFRVTMAAIDPTAEPEGDEDEIVRPRATLKVLRLPLGEDDSELDMDGMDSDSDSEMDVEDMDRHFGGVDGLGEHDSDDYEFTGGPSDPAKSKQAKRAAAEKQIKKLLEKEGMDMDDDEDNMPNGINGIVKSSKAKGKMPASDEDDDEDSDMEDDDEMGGEIEEFVICTLDPDKHYQQPLDITFGERERVWFKVTGTHTIYLTGNYVEPAYDPSGTFDPDSDEEDEYDLSPDEDELDDSENESVDELDNMEDPRILEIEDEDDEVPSLVKTETKKIDRLPAVNKNKRPAPDSADEDEAEPGAMSIDDLITKEAQAIQPTINGESKLSKKQLKKLKKNNGAATGAPVVEKTEVKIQEKKEPDPPSSSKSDKKVTFANQLEQGPTPTKTDKPAEKKDEKPKSASLGVKTVQGVKIDDKKIGSGQAAKKGDRVGMRYIGKLEKDGKVFDANKKGKPFSFKIGSGEVIKGLEIGTEGMQAGGERRVTIPAHMGYGSKKQGEIPPNSSLIFDVKLLEINKGK